MKEDHENVKDVALMHQEIVKQLSQYENGVVVETMENMGLKYEMNYGLSIPQIDLIAKAMKKDNALAIFLWQQKERESKLLALRIFKDFNLSSDVIADFLEGIRNTELAEQSVIHTLIKLEKPYKIAAELIKKDKFIQLAGFLLVSRLALTDKTADNAIFDHFLIEIVQNLPKENAVYLWRGLAQAFLRIGLRSQELKNAVMDAIKTLDKINQGLYDYLNQEVNYYLIENN